jgi:hypothetical protein
MQKSRGCRDCGCRCMNACCMGACCQESIGRRVRVDICTWWRQYTAMVVLLRHPSTGRRERSSISMTNR